MQTTCFYFMQSFFKNKKSSGTSLPGSFSASQLKKIFSLLYYIDQISFSGYPYSLRCIVRYVYCNCLLTRLWPLKWTLYFCMTKTSRKRFWERKELSRWNKKHFASFLKDFHLSKYNNFFWKVRARLSELQVLSSDRSMICVLIFFWTRISLPLT